jgi:acetolactate synthase I/III small subunit
LVRAPRLHRGGRGFESLAVYHFSSSSQLVYECGSFIMRHIISILVENKFGTLARIAGMFSGRGFNIETLNVGPMLDDRFSRITTTIVGDSDALEQAIRQVNKLINVIEVTEYASEQATERELVMLRVTAPATVRSDIMQICDIFRAKVIDVAATSVNIEMTGNANKINGFLKLIEPYGIAEMARTGNLALKRG